jgi:hypothetical protein
LERQDLCRDRSSTRGVVPRGDEYGADLPRDFGRAKDYREKARAIGSRDLDLHENKVPTTGVGEGVVVVEPNRDLDELSSLREGWANGDRSHRGVTGRGHGCSRGDYRGRQQGDHEGDGEGTERVTAAQGDQPPAINGNATP